MKRISCAVVTLLVGALAARAAPDANECRYLEHPAAVAEPVTKTSIRLLATTPAEGGDVRKDTVIGIDVEYRVANFQADTLYLTALFPTIDGSSTGPGDSRNTPPLTAPAGTAHLCVPLTTIYDNENMRWPLSLFVLMIEMQGRRGQGVGATRSVKFNALDPPPGALAPHVDGLAEKYGDSVKGSWEYLTHRTVRYKSCIARFADLQPALTRAYRAWEARHHADIELIAESLFELDKQRAKGRADAAADYEDAFVEAQRTGFDRMPVERARQQCQRTLDELSDTDDPTEGAIGDYIDYVKKHRPEYPLGEDK